MRRRRPIRICARCGWDTSYDRSSSDRRAASLCIACFNERGELPCVECNERRLKLERALCARCDRAKAKAPRTSGALDHSGRDPDPNDFDSLQLQAERGIP